MMAVSLLLFEVTSKNYKDGNFKSCVRLKNRHLEIGIASDQLLHTRDGADFCGKHEWGKSRLVTTIDISFVSDENIQILLVSSMSGHMQCCLTVIRLTKNENVGEFAKINF